MDALLIVAICFIGPGLFYFMLAMKLPIPPRFKWLLAVAFMLAYQLISEAVR